MEGNIFQNVIHTFKDKLKRNPKKNPSMNEYAFSSEDLDELAKNNIEKIKELKKETKKKETVLDNNNLDDTILNKEETKEEINIKEKELATKEENQNTKHSKVSYINLEKDNQDLIMTKWKEIDLNTIDKDIIEGKDLLNHNYTITYADDAEKFIHEIRKKYEIILCYLIGFNNEKKGIYDKTYFSDSKDTEWQHLNSYIKVLEKIRNFKSHE